MRSLVGAAPRVARLGTALTIGSLLAACGNSTGATFTVGFLAVRNDGLPQVLSGGGLAATGPGSASAYPGGTYYIYPGAPVSLATGVYTLAVPVPAATFDSIFAGTPDRPRITVVRTLPSPPSSDTNPPRRRAWTSKSPACRRASPAPSSGSSAGP